MHGLESRGIEQWRLLVAMPMSLWGFWYPPYILGGRLVFNPPSYSHFHFDQPAWIRV